VGNFPIGWTEWNGDYRDKVRSFWKGEPDLASTIATRLAGSSDLYQQSGRAPYASINFITCHDGFTLQDLVSYNEKHNEANGENNNDGASDNKSWNCGAEGPTEDPDIRKLRDRQRRNFIATLFLSQGVPMLLAGDELSHSQKGNNNTYCQDNELSWLNWELDEDQQRFLSFVKMVTGIWQEQPVFQRSTFFQGRAIRGSDIKDISFFNPSGQEMSDEDWNAGYVQCLGVRLAGDLIGDMSERGEPIIGDTTMLLLNAHHESIEFTLPATKEEHRWERLFDTAFDSSDEFLCGGEEAYTLQGRSVALFVTRIPQDVGLPVNTTQVEHLRRKKRRPMFPVRSESGSPT
jgi:glycogen operon protein